MLLPIFSQYFFIIIYKRGIYSSGEDRSLISRFCAVLCYLNDTLILKRFGPVLTVKGNILCVIFQEMTATSIVVILIHNCSSLAYYP